MTQEFVNHERLSQHVDAFTLQMNNFIHRLDLTGNSIESKGALHIARSLRDNVSITNLVGSSH